jgi:asparagine synthase (glutamine-hydrolysing)
MCGIAGIWNFDGKPILNETIERFTDSLAHRGPDGRGIWKSNAQDIAFGHRRLAIIDLSHEADQPMHYAENRYHIVFNGEIFNFIEIRKELMAKGYSFKTDSDTEVILASYHCWKEKMLFKFNGMWAIVIYDEQEKSCFISRDRFGIKPLLYKIDKHQFVFASEQKSFRCLDGYTPEMDNESAAYFLKTGFGVEASSRTMLKDIWKLQAGCWGIVKDGKVYLNRWWETSDHLVDIPETFEKQAERFQEIFYDSIQLRMRSDVSIGSSLSGGFDSSAIVSALAEIGKQHSDLRQSKDWQQTFVATFPGKSNDERPKAEEVIRYAGVKGHFFEVHEDEALKVMNQVLDDFDDVYVGIPVAPWLIYRELRRNNIVVSLDGHGADELMGAYMHASGAYLANAPSLLGNWQYNKQLLKQSHELTQTIPQFATNLKRLVQFHPDFELGRKAFKKLKSFKDQFVQPQSSQFVNKDVAVSNVASFQSSSNIPTGMDETNGNLYALFHHDVLPTILRNFDRMSMAHGIEVRMPFMDWRLVTYAFSLPGSAKIKDGYTKRIAREAMKNRMPESIRSSKVKIGFNAPMPEWFQGPLQPWIKETLENAKSNGNELIDVKGLVRYIEQQQKTNNWNWSTTGNTWKYLHLLWFQQNYLKNE